MRGGHTAIRYALIGLAPYVFHFDLSKTYIFKSRVLPYLIAFNDIHNLPTPFEFYRNLLREDWLTQKPSIEKVNLNGVKSKRVIEQKVIENGRTTNWDKKYYPQTRDEYIKILDDYLTLCEENNIQAIMVRMRNSDKYIKNFNPTMLEEYNNFVEEALKKHPDARFVDGWKWNGVTYEDFYDHGHMNFKGAAKFSAWLNEYIEQLER